MMQRSVLRAIAGDDVVEIKRATASTELSGGERSRVARRADSAGVEAPVILADERPRRSTSVTSRRDEILARERRSRRVVDSGHARYRAGGAICRHGYGAFGWPTGSQGAPADAASPKRNGRCVRISAYRAEYQREAVIVPGRKFEAAGMRRGWISCRDR